MPVGYSMGGAIAQLGWLRHRERIAGLVLAATAMRFSRSGSQRRDQAMFGGMAGLARLLPAPAMRWGSEQIFLRRKRDQWDTWAVEAAERHDWRAIVEAGVALGNFHSQPWIPDIDVPVSVVVTTDDPVVPTRRQWQLVNAARPGGLHCRRRSPQRRHRRFRPRSSPHRLGVARLPARGS